MTDFPETSPRDARFIVWAVLLISTIGLIVLGPAWLAALSAYFLGCVTMTLGNSKS